MADEPTVKNVDSGADSEAEPLAPAISEPLASIVPTVAPDPGYTPGGVPTFESVREKIETRYGTALGSAELDAQTPEGRSLEDQYESRKRAAADLLDEIRASMRSRQEPTEPREEPDPQGH